MTTDDRHRALRARLVDAGLDIAKADEIAAEYGRPHSAIVSPDLPKSPGTSRSGPLTVS